MGVNQRVFSSSSTSDAPVEHASPSKATEEEDTGRKAKELSSPSKAHRKADAIQALLFHPQTPAPFRFTNLVRPGPFTAQN